VRAGLSISTLLHAALLAWAILSIQQTTELRRPDPEPIAVAMITPSEFLALKKGSETATELEAKASDKPVEVQSKLEAEKPKPVLAPTPPAEAEPAKPEPAPEPPKAAEEPPPPEPPKSDPIAEKLAEAPPPEPPPGPTPDELKKQEEEKKAAEEAQKKAEEEKKRKADEKKKAEQKKKAEEAKKKAAEAKRKKEEEEKKKKESVSDRLAALLDKDPTKKGAPATASEPTKPTDYKGPTAGTETGDSPVLSVREQDLLRGMLQRQLARCWRLPGAGGGTETPIVTLRWRMRPDGTLESDPRIEKPASGPLAALATESAMRAVKGCQPFDLPPDLYATGWQEIIWEFDPSSML
jgi:colicin import membrane protein